ncbi:MAG: UDP-N-acetylglucosamine 2-epimerase (non-hydrolyzing) [candidate division WOR-3 bacterium]|nr:UDP-N-acetylglucosamine 2-epimerase (non-hydrolyzing) [candidate division WOR-3 bacterium]MCX7836691.1 UDP-N-acetylglucosamine 2-epimerase (non-hydrolyzing) [candidate division WOR-3 bacterium]MDW8113472.1 UDP-N-acetylglucosamine 2-epimerase (non-hydrolyzing) [candidate division WOR-3 bacterium]
MKIAKILFALGTRPEAIKLAPVIQELRKESNKKFFESYVCITAQHREMLDEVLKLFKIQVDYDLDIMEPNQTPRLVTEKILKKFYPYLKKVNPDLVIVQGDTTSAFACALLAFYEKIKVAHVEAGLRTEDKYQPYPEEINRRLISPLADINFAPTKIAEKNLLKENIDKEKIFVTGNTVVDALLKIKKEFRIKKNNVKKEKNILVTIHRRENWGKPLEEVCEAIKKLAEIYPFLKFYIPVHLNPNVKEVIHKKLENLSQVNLLRPLPYFQLLELMGKSFLILTDSGGICEEAPSFNVPVLILRNKTERKEVVVKGLAKLVGTSYENIIKNVSELINNSKKYNQMVRKINPFGDGKAAKRIVDFLKFYYGFTNKKPKPFSN